MEYKNVQLIVYIHIIITCCVVLTSISWAFGAEASTSLTINLCGDGSCNYGENCTTCVIDCGSCSPQIGPGHGDLSVPGTKKTNKTLNVTSKPLIQNNPGTEIQIAQAVCGDSICSATEDCRNCAYDCGACQVEPPVLSSELAITPLQGGIITMAVLAAMGLGIYVSRKFSQASKYRRKK